MYPLRAEAAFEYADRLGYDGVELMVWGESVSQDIDAVRKLSRRYRVPVLSVHAPCLLISQRVWGANPILKLDRSVRAPNNWARKRSSCIRLSAGNDATPKGSAIRLPP